MYAISGRPETGDSSPHHWKTLVHHVHVPSVSKAKCVAFTTIFTPT